MLDPCLKIVLFDPLSLGSEKKGEGCHTHILARLCLFACDYVSVGHSLSVLLRQDAGMAAVRLNMAEWGSKLLVYSTSSMEAVLRG